MTNLCETCSWAGLVTDSTVAIASNGSAGRFFCTIEYDKAVNREPYADGFNDAIKACDAEGYCESYLDGRL